MKTLDSIPTHKIERATKLVSTGVKIGGNYLRYYGEKLINGEENKDKLNANNAKDIYDGLKELKGSALKLAQMLSMEKNLMPQAYVEQFSLAQFSVPPLSGALVKKTIRKYLGSDPDEIFESFSLDSENAASIGQVHKAEKDGKKLAVKIQYPGVAQSIASDLSLVKPIAIKMLNIKGKDSDKYFKEVENKLVEETNYTLEIDQSQSIVEDCKHIPNLKFPNYYPTLSSDRIITMDWMNGVHLSEFSTTNQKVANSLGQALWDFYMFQIHKLKKVHADPHPGNFLINKENQLIALDFGCIKEVPNDFYIPYFELAKKENLANPEFFKSKLYELEILRKDDSKEEVEFFTTMFHELLSLFAQPFHAEEFNFADDAFFGQIANLGENYSKSTELRNMNGNRGSKHFIYINRTFFGLYNLMHDLKAEKVKINNFIPY